MSLSKFQEMVKGREAWRAQRVRQDLVTQQQTFKFDYESSRN